METTQYNAIFSAIAEATKTTAGGISISVAKFEEVLAKHGRYVETAPQPILHALGVKEQQP